MSIIKKALGLLCALVLIIGSLYVPVALPAFAAESEATVFDFSDVVAQNSVNSAEATENGVGYYGWGFQRVVDNDNAIIRASRPNEVTYSTIGGYRLHNGTDVYYLEPSTQYVVTMKLRVSAGNIFLADSTTVYTSYVSLGYGAYFNPQMGGNTTNYVNGMSTELVRIVTSVSGEETYTLSNLGVQSQCEYSDEWKTVTYSFTTPADMSGKDTALTIWATKFTGMVCDIDDVSVTKLGDNTGVIILKDEFSGTSEVLTGDIGTAAILPDLNEAATEGSPEFLGWYTDEDRTVSADGIMFTAEKQTVYSKWNSEVSITFIDSLNNTNETISGEIGESFSYPAEPVDKSGETWFTGWYTTEEYTEEHTSGVFGHSDITLYAQWKGEIPGLTQDFENYNKEQYEVTSSSSLGKIKDNRNYFHEAMEKQSAVTYNNSGYAIKFDWDSTMVNDPEDENTYRTAGRIDTPDMKLWLGSGLDNNENYVATVRYKVENAETDFRFIIGSGASNNIWTGTVLYGDDSANNIDHTALGDGWLEEKISFTTNFSGNHNTMYLLIKLAENKDVTLYIDDISIDALAQPYESVLTVVPNNGEENTIYKGTRGEALPLPQLVNANGAEFLGWYADEALTQKLTATTYTRAHITAYAKWSAAALTFKDYPYNSTERAKFGIHTLFIREGENIGWNDNYALNFLFDGDSTFYRGETLTVMNTRAGDMDHAATIGKVEDGKTYAVTYYYKTNAACETGYTIKLFSGNGNNIYDATNRKTYSNTTVTFSADETDWVKKTVIFTADIAGSNYNNLYILFNSTDRTESAYVDAYVDHITIQEATNVIYFHENGGDNETDYAVGEAGESYVSPTFSNGDNIFQGWYTDAQCTKIFTSNTIPAGITHLYAKWANGPITFKDYPYNSTERAKFGIYSLFIREGENIGLNDNYALNFLFDGDSTFYRGETLTYMYERAGQIDHVAKIGEVTSGSLYKVTYYYKTNAACKSNYTIQLFTANGNNIFASGAVLYESTKITVEAEESDWIKQTVLFSPNFTVANSNSLFIKFNSLDSTPEAYIDAYVDHIYVEELTGNVIYFHSNTEGVSDDVVSGSVGEAFTAPVMTNGKAQFLGWYTDAACTVPFTATTIPSGTTHVYAKWSTAPLTFEEYESKFGTTQTSTFGATMKIAKGNNVGIDDNYALQVNFVGNEVYRVNADGSTTYIYSRANTNTNIAKIGSVVNGTVYRLTYYYKQNSSNANVTIFPSTGNPTNIWGGGYKAYNSAGVTVSSGTNGTWQKAEVYFTAEIPSANPTSNGLFLQYSVAPASMDTVCDLYIDNVLLEAVNTPYIFVQPNNGSSASVIQGKVGDTIVLPEGPTSFGKKFIGWYKDADCTAPFTTKFFTEGMAITIYAGYARDNEVTYDFENYTIPYKGEAGSLNQRQDAYLIQTDKAYSGKNVIEYDRTGTYNVGSSYHAIAHGNEIFTALPNEKYVISVRYYIAQAALSDFTISAAAALQGNFWANITISENIHSIHTREEVGVWKTANLIFDSSKITKSTANALYIRILGGEDGILWIDDVTITTVPEGQSAVLIVNEGCRDIPPVLIGKPGTSYASKLPENPVYGNKFFKGYFTLEADGTYKEMERDAMKFADTALTLYARFVDKVVTQDFDNDDYRSSIASAGDVFTIFDFDYELYDSQAEGNSKDNVTSGRYSLHRKGNSMYFENALVLTLNNHIAEGERYTVTFKVKMGEYKHTNGAVKVASGRSFRYAWTTTGDYYPVVPIADLTDGQWHTVSYTFNSVESYVSIQTPGYVELFIDDVVFTLVDEATPLSTAPAYTEYVQAELDEAGNPVYTADEGLDITSIIDASLYLNNGDGGVMIIVIAACSAAVLLIVAAVIIFIVIKRKKKAKA